MSVLSICIVLRAFVVVFSMCLLYRSLWSDILPSCSFEPIRVLIV